VKCKFISKHICHNYVTYIPQLFQHTKECVEIKCQLDATEVFIADLIACSTCFGHHCAQNMLSKQ